MKNVLADEEGDFSLIQNSNGTREAVTEQGIKLHGGRQRAGDFGIMPGTLRNYETLTWRR